MYKELDKQYMIYGIVTNRVKKWLKNNKMHKINKTCYQI